MARVNQQGRSQNLLLQLVHIHVRTSTCASTSPCDAPLLLPAPIHASTSIVQSSMPVPHHVQYTSVPNAPPTRCPLCTMPLHVPVHLRAMPTSRSEPRHLDTGCGGFLHGIAGWKLYTIIKTILTDQKMADGSAFPRPLATSPRWQNKICRRHPQPDGRNLSGFRKQTMARR